MSATRVQVFSSVAGLSIVVLSPVSKRMSPNCSLSLERVKVDTSRKPIPTSDAAAASETVSISRACATRQISMVSTSSRMPLVR